MKKFFLFLFFILPLVGFTQAKHYNLKHNVMANGYDVISYFKKRPIKGNFKYTVTYKKVKYLFYSERNRNTFKANPKKYIPQYGGWCAYTMGQKGTKVDSNPKNFEIRNGKLYLFSSGYFNNSFENWTKEGPNRLRDKANRNWRKYIHH